MIKVCACYNYFDLNTGMTECTLRSRTIWTIFSVSGLPFPFYKMCVPSDLYLCYLQPLLSSPGWTPAKSALVSVAFFPLHCTFMLSEYISYIYSFFPLDKKKLYIAIRVFPPLILLDSFTLQYLPSFPCAWCCWWVESSPRQHLLWWCSVPREHQATYKPVITLHWLPSRLWANFCSLCRWDLSLMP